ncbi:MAG: hypothetical protein U5J63_07820 [Fodinibius sp.]|nr:hypothetical protein [Fodinibius sp.]
MHGRPLTRYRHCIRGFFRSLVIVPMMTTIIDDIHKEYRIDPSYAEFYQHVRNCARLLQNHGPVRASGGNHPHNHWHTVVQYYASWSLGLVVAPINLAEDDERILREWVVDLLLVRTSLQKSLSQDFKLYDITLIYRVDRSREEYFKPLPRKSGDLDRPDESMAESEALID